MHTMRSTSDDEHIGEPTPPLLRKSYQLKSVAGLDHIIHLAEFDAFNLH